MVLLLTLDGSESATHAACIIDENQFILDYGINLVSCLPDIIEVNEENFTIFSGTNSRIEGFKLTQQKGVKYLPTNLFSAFPGLVAISYWYNAVKSVNENHFKGLTKLRGLFLTNNEIEHMAEDSFTDLVSLEYLNLGGNKISSLQRNLFASQKNLKKLCLDRNLIQSLPSSIFRSLANVEYLFLTRNKISSIDESTFAHMYSLKELYMSFNELERIPGGLFKNNLELNKVYMTGNKISFIDAKIFDHLSELGYIEFYDNLCIENVFYPYGAKFIPDIRLELEQKCADNSID